MSGSLFLLNILLFPLLCRSSEDASDVTWGHAINSRKALEDALQSDLNFLEADVSLGSTDSENGIPIMAHPPETHSDISLEEWITTFVNGNTKKGIKLDFKATEVLEPALKILDKKRLQLTFPLWLNADILDGPFNPDANHVDTTTFLTLCQQYFPTATLSVGWTTQLGRNVMRYSWNDVSEMARVLLCQNISQPITFPIRGVFVKDSIPQFLWLSVAIPKSTFTVWSAVVDPLQVSDLLELRKALPVSQVYYDLPANQNKEFLNLKNTVKSSNSVGTNLQLKTLSDSFFTCNSETIVGDNSIVYGGQGAVAVIHSGVVKGDVEISGRYYPCDTVGACPSVFESKFTIKVADSADFWNSDAWANPGGEFLTIMTSNPIEGSLCNVSFHIIIKSADKHDSVNDTQVNITNSGTSETCPVLVEPSSHEVIYGDMYVGVVIEGSRPITIENFTVTTTGEGASLTPITILLSILCAIPLCVWIV